MEKNIKNQSLSGILLFLLIAVMTLTACSSTNSVAATRHVSGTAPTSTPVQQKTLPTPTPTPKPKPTPTPVPAVTVSWNSAPSTVYTIQAANVRNAPSTNGTIITTESAGQQLTVYGSANGQPLGSSVVWYRISAQNSTPQYIYSSLVSANKPAPVLVYNSCNGTSGKIIIINLTSQHLWACNNGAEFLDTMITSGRPGLETPTGLFHIFTKESPTWFYSPWPKGDPRYYPPTYINYAMEFNAGGYFIHDSTWRTVYGPGSEYPHTLYDGTPESGSHGCVNVMLSVMVSLYSWTPTGTPVSISY